MIEDGDDAKAIIDKVVSAHGGADKLTKWERGFVRYTTKVGIEPFSFLGECVVEDTFDYPDRQKRVVSGRTKGEDIKLVIVTNGEDAWTKMGNSPSNRMPKSLAPPVSEHALGAVSMILRMCSDGREISRQRDKVIDGRDVVVVRMTTDGGDLELLIDKQTGLLKQTEMETFLPFPRDASARSHVLTLLDDYKELDGWRYPMRIRRFRDGEAYVDVVISDIRLLNTIGASEFEKPK